MIAETELRARRDDAVVIDSACSRRGAGFARGVRLVGRCAASCSCFAGAHPTAAAFSKPVNANQLESVLWQLCPAHQPRQTGQQKCTDVGRQHMVGDVPRRFELAHFKVVRTRLLDTDHPP